jgi:magnesium transporter
LWVIPRIEASTASEYLSSVTKDERTTLVEMLDEETKRDILMLASFDDDEIGSRMTTNFVTVTTGLSVREAMREVVKQAADNDNIATIYVIDEDGTFLGAIDLKDLIIAREGTELSSIILTSYPYVYAYEQIDNCIERIKDYSEDSIPVLDADNKLQGVLISQDITELVEEEMGEDYAKLAGLSSEEDLEEPLKKSIGKRLPWLVVLLGLGLVVSSVVGIFEGVVSHIAIIVSFQSLILGMAGNVGTQSLAVTIRVLMDEELGVKQKLFLIGKEARIGLINGVILGLLSFVLIGLYLLLFKGQAPMYAFAVSACTALALLVAILLSSLSGTIIPIIFKRIKIDPAVASGPLITTINDLVAVVAYYGLAWVLLINVLGL